MSYLLNEDMYCGKKTVLCERLFAFNWLNSSEGLVDACVDDLSHTNLMECTENFPASIPALPSVTEVVESVPLRRPSNWDEARQRCSPHISADDVGVMYKLASPRIDSRHLPSVDENKAEEICREKQKSPVLIENNDNDELIETLIEHAEINAAEVEGNITKTFTKIIEKLNERKLQLLSMVKSALKEKITRLNADKKTIQKSEQKNNNMCNAERHSNTDNLFAGLCFLGNVDNPQNCHLPHGTTSFNVDPDIYKTIQNLGLLQEDLSSSLHTVVGGHGMNYGLVDVQSTFDVHTRTKNGHACGSDHDDVKVIIVNQDATSRYHGNVTRTSLGAYKVTYTIPQAGDYKVHVFLNSLSLPSSPYPCSIYKKCDLRFDPCCGQGKQRTLSDTLFTRRTSIDGNWVLQKDYKSAVMSNTSSDHCKIFCSNSLRGGVYAWRISLTTACTSVRLAIGVATKSFIKDLEEEYFCSFKLQEAPKKIGTPHRQRKVSTFERHSHCYVTILNAKERWLKVIACDGNDEQILTLPDEQINYYPTFVVEHLCKKMVCPRPMLSFT